MSAIYLHKYRLGGLESFSCSLPRKDQEEASQNKKTKREREDETRCISYSIQLGRVNLARVGWGDANNRSPPDNGSELE
jgi:hypothetical protein